MLNHAAGAIPIRLQDGQALELMDQLSAKTELGIWSELSAKNFSDAFDLDTLQLRSDFLRRPNISFTLHPDQRDLGIRIGQYLARTSFGSRLMSLYSDSHFGCPYFIAPDLSGFSSVCLQHLSYVQLIMHHLNIDLTSVNEPFQFIDFGGGYGNMARLLVHLNENIMVDIVDIPHMLMLQKAFLQTTISNKRMLERINFHHSAVESYERVIKARAELHPHRHVNATFSLNEIPLSLRSGIEHSLLRNADSFFVAYSLKILGLDNAQWVNSFCSGIQDLFDLTHGYLPGYEPNRFITGRRRKPAAESEPNERSG